MEASSRLQKAIEHVGETCLHLFCRFAYKGDSNACMEPGATTDIPIPEMDQAAILLMEKLWVVLGSPWTPWVCLGFFLVGHEVWRLKKVKREAKESRINSWFSLNLPREIYYTIVLQQVRAAQEHNSQTQSEVPILPSDKETQAIHNAALLRWAVESLRRALHLKHQKETYTSLMMAGIVGRDLLEWLVVADKEVNKDLMSIKALARGVDSEFGENIMASAYNIMEREDFDKKLAVIEERREEEKAWWEARRQMILRELVAEFGGDDLGVPQKLLANTDAEANGNSKTRKRKGSKPKAKGKGKK